MNEADNELKPVVWWYLDTPRLVSRLEKLCIWLPRARKQKISFKNRSIFTIFLVKNAIAKLNALYCLQVARPVSRNCSLFR